MTERSPRRLPMFPLGTVLFPYALLPLHVFEPRYRMMMRGVLRGDQEFGVVLIERGREVGGGDTRFALGTLARVVRATELDDGRYALTAVGVRRLRVDEWLADDPYPQAMVVELNDDDDDDDASDVHGTVARVADELRRLLALWTQFEPRVADMRVEIADEPRHAAYDIAALAPLGPLDAQRVLEADDTPARLARLEAMLRDEIEVLEARRPE